MKLSRRYLERLVTVESLLLAGFSQDYLTLFPCGQKKLESPEDRDRDHRGMCILWVLNKNNRWFDKKRKEVPDVMMSCAHLCQGGAESCLGGT
jgi:hypothetical protein